MGASGGTSDGLVKMESGAQIKNVGTFNDDSYDKECAYQIGDAFKIGGGTTPSITNTGTFESELGSGNEAKVAVDFINDGTMIGKSGALELSDGGSASNSTWSVSSGAEVAMAGGSFELTGEMHSTSEGLTVAGGTVTAAGISGAHANISITTGSLKIGSGTSTLESLSVTGGTLGLTGTLDVTSSLSVAHSPTINGSGQLVLESGGTGQFGTGKCSLDPTLSGATLVNEGTITMGASGGRSDGLVKMESGAQIKNVGTFYDDSYDKECAYHIGDAFEAGSGTAPSIINTGTFKSELGSGNEAKVTVDFDNNGQLIQASGTLIIEHPIVVESSTTWGGSENPSAPSQPHATCGDPVSCATGNYTETQTDFSIGGRGVGLDLTRTYNSQAAAEGVKGVFGYGWTSSFSEHFVVNKTSKITTLYQSDGSTVPFTEGSGESFTAPGWTQDTLSGSEGSGYTLTLVNQTKYKFAGSSGRLESMTDRDGNETTLTYNGSGELTTITDPSGRTIKLAYNGEGLVESAEDPMGHVVKYTYESKNLKSVTQPAEAGLRWQVQYNGSHEMTEMVDGRGGKTINEYNGSKQVTKQEDPAKRKLKFEYEAFHTKITNETTGSITNEYFTSNDEPSSITHGYGTAAATTESFAYNEDGYVTSVTDGNGHTTKYGYDAANDRTSEINPDNDETKWTYNSTHDVISTTTPKSETTTIKRETDGNPEAIERPAPGSETQITKYTYGTYGELKSVTNPLSHKWEYEYDSYGDRTAEIDPLGNKRTWEYNADSQETSTVSPRGNVVGGEPSKYTTKIERTAQGRPLKVTDTLGHTTKYTYDGDGNVGNRY